MPHISLKPPMSVSGTIGLPTDGSYDTGIVGLLPSDIFADAADKLDEFLALITNIVAPPPGNLSGQDLVIIGTITYQAIIPNGAPASWIDSAGTTITTYITDNILILQSPDASNYFIAGIATLGQETAGQITHILNGIDADVHDIAVSGVGTTGILSCTVLVAHNIVFYRANAEIALVAVEGKSRHVLKHTQAGQTNELPLYYDDENPFPSFEDGPSYTVGLDVAKWLSGIQYHGQGTTFNIDAIAASGIFRKAYHPTNVALISVPGNDDVSHNPPPIPGINDNWEFDKDMILGNNIAQQVGYGTVELYKPNGDVESDITDDFPRSINTYGIVSTNVDERFLDEDKRLTQVGGVWDPTAVLVNGNAQVYNGDLRHGADGDYPAHVSPAVYIRRIYKPTASNGILTFQGITYTDITPYGTGNLNVILLLETEGKYFDIGRMVGDDNGNGSGDSLVNSYGSRITGVGGVVDFSFLLHSTGLNGNQYGLIVLLLTSGGPIITRITGS